MSERPKDYPYANLPHASGQGTVSNPNTTWNYGRALPAAYGHTMAFPHSHYIQQLQAFSNFASADNRGTGNVFPSSAGVFANPLPTPVSSSTPPASVHGKDLSPGVAYPPGHPMSYMSSYARPIPAHGPLQAHLRGTDSTNSPNANSPAPAPLPAHISNPYQPTTNYHALGGNQPYPPPHAPPHHPNYMPPHVPASSNPPSDPRYPGSIPDKATLANSAADPQYLSNGLHNASRSLTPGHQQQPQQYGNPKEFTNLAMSKPTSAAATKNHKTNNNFTPSSVSGNGIPASFDYSPASNGSDSIYGGPDSMATRILNSMGAGNIWQDSPEIPHQKSSKSSLPPKNDCKAFSTNASTAAAPLPLTSKAQTTSTFNNPFSNVVKSPEKGTVKEKTLFKRKNSSENGEILAKRRKEASCDFSADDPYSFEDDDKDSVASSVEFARFGVQHSRKSQSGPVYKFKNALLSRGSRTSSTDSRSSTCGLSKSVPLNFEKIQETFDDSCDMFIDDLQNKPVTVSRKPNMDAYRERLAAKKKRNANLGRKKKVIVSDVVEQNENTNGDTEIDLPQNQSSSSPTSSTPGTANLESAKPPPLKKTPVRKKKSKEDGDNSENPCDDQQKPRCESDPKPLKKGGLWALPIVPKLPQKQEKRRSSPAPPAVTPKSNKDVDLGDVWRQAFGGVKQSKKPSNEIPGPSQTSSGKVKQEVEDPIKSSTFLDIPPEVRRKPKPTFGGLLHFPPDWEQRVRKFQEKNRLPKKLWGINFKPKILRKDSGTSSLISSPGFPAEKLEAPSISPQNKYKSTNSHPVRPRDDFSPPKLVIEASSPILNSLIKGVGAPDVGTPNIVDAILAKRKERLSMGRMYKVPFQKEKEKRKKSFDKLPEDGIGLLPTPGLPALTEDTTDILMGTNFGNFRRQTLMRYFDSLDDAAELKAKILDWKPEVLETKTRRQSNQVKVVTSYREIFGIDLPSSDSKEKGKGKKSSTPVKKKKKPEEKLEEKVDQEENVEEPEVKVKVESTKNEKHEVKDAKTPKKSSKKKAKDPETSTNSTPSKFSTELLKADNSLKEDSDTETPPTEKEEELQSFLQSFALDLLDDNLSWNNKTVIQNLVIWEPVGPVIPEKRVKKKPKKHRKRQSGLDFSSSAKKKGKSRDTSRAGSPIDSSKEIYSVTYGLDNVINESKEMVIDKGAGETILHRAAKMGYPDVVAYAIDHANMPPGIKDNAGIPPIHKAAFKGHADIVKILMRYGVDPNTNVKGTRPLHEALEGGHIDAVYNLLSYGADPLLYDYSGNMPIDLTEGDEDMRRYLSNVLSDLHGKPGERWNVSHSKSFTFPPQRSEDENDDAAIDEDDFSSFVISSQSLPPFYAFPNHPGQYVRLTDIKPKVDPKHFNIISMPWEEFVKLGRCNLLGSPVVQVNKSQTSVELVLVDQALKKLLGVEGLPSPTKSPKNSRRS